MAADVARELVEIAAINAATLCQTLVFRVEHGDHAVRVADKHVGLELTHTALGVAQARQEIVASRGSRSVLDGQVRHSQPRRPR